MNLNESQRFRLAIRALMRLSRPYSYGSAFRTFLRPLNSRRFMLALRLRERAVICSQLFHEAYMEASGSTPVERADIAVVPAEPSAIDKLEEIGTHWVRLAKAVQHPGALTYGKRRLSCAFGLGNR